MVKKTGFGNVWNYVSALIVAFVTAVGHTFAHFGFSDLDVFASIALQQGGAVAIIAFIITMLILVIRDV